MKQISLKRIIIVVLCGILCGCSASNDSSQQKDGQPTPAIGEESAVTNAAAVIIDDSELTSINNLAGIYSVFGESVFYYNKDLESLVKDELTLKNPETVGTLDRVEDLQRYDNYLLYRYEYADGISKDEYGYGSEGSEGKVHAVHCITTEGESCNFLIDQIQYDDNSSAALLPEAEGGYYSLRRSGLTTEDEDVYVYNSISKMHVTKNGLLLFTVKKKMNVENNAARYSFPSEFDGVTLYAADLQTGKAVNLGQYERVSFFGEIIEDGKEIPIISISSGSSFTYQYAVYRIAEENGSLEVQPFYSFGDNELVYVSVSDNHVFISRNKKSAQDGTYELSGGELNKVSNIPFASISKYGDYYYCVGEKGLYVSDLTFTKVAKRYDRDSTLDGAKISIVGNNVFLNRSLAFSIEESSESDDSLLQDTQGEHPIGTIVFNSWAESYSDNLYPDGRHPTSLYQWIKQAGNEALFYESYTDEEGVNWYRIPRRIWVCDKDDIEILNEVKQPPKFTNSVNSFFEEAEKAVYYFSYGYDAPVDYEDEIEIDVMRYNAVLNINSFEELREYLRQYLTERYTEEIIQNAKDTEFLMEFGGKLYMHIGIGGLDDMTVGQKQGHTALVFPSSDKPFEMTHETYYTKQEQNPATGYFEPTGKEWEIHNILKFENGDWLWDNIPNPYNTTEKNTVVW